LSEGFLLDRTRNDRTNARWVEGAPRRSFWRGLDLRGRMSLPVTALRCPRCGYLELYAPATSPDSR
jgi:hypothetical protein